MKIKSLFLLTIILSGSLFGQGSSQTATDYIAKRIQFTLLNPPQPVSFASVSVSGNPGPATYYYWIVTQTSVGASSPAGPFAISSGPNSLTVSNFNQVSWSPVAGAISYDVLRTSNAGPPFGSCNCAVATGVAGTTANDQTNSLNAYTVSPLDPNTLTVIAQNNSGTLAFTGPVNFSGLITVSPQSANLQATLNSACTGNLFGTVMVPPGTYTVTPPLTIDGNCNVWWFDAKVVPSSGASGDIIQINNQSNVAFFGKLMIDGTGGGTASTSEGLHLITVTNFSFEDIETNNTKDACILSEGSQHVRGNRIRGTNSNQGVGSTSSCITLQNSSNGAGATANTDWTVDEIDTSHSGSSDNVFVLGNSTTNAQRINLGNLTLTDCQDSCLETNFIDGFAAKNITLGPNAVNSGVLFRRGSKNINVDSISVPGTTKIGVDVANFLTSDGATDKVNIGKITCSGISGDLSNGACFRISNCASCQPITNVTVNQIVADTSTRGIYITGSSPSGLVSHVVIGSIDLHNNKGDGVKVVAANDVNINGGTIFDNGTGGVGSDFGFAFDLVSAANSSFSNIRIFDDQGGSKTQVGGFRYDAASTGNNDWSNDCQDALTTGGACIVDLGTSNFHSYRSTSTGVQTFKTDLTSSNGARQFIGKTDIRLDLLSAAGVCDNLELLGLNGGNTFLADQCAGSDLNFQVVSGRQIFLSKNGTAFPATQTIGSATVTTAGTAVAAGTCQAQTGITITGSVTTDMAQANIGATLPATWQTGIRYQAEVTASGTCTVNLCNPTAASITPAATAVRCTVMR